MVLATMVPRRSSRSIVRPLTVGVGDPIGMPGENRALVAVGPNGPGPLAPDRARSAIGKDRSHPVGDSPVQYSDGAEQGASNGGRRAAQPRQLDPGLPAGRP